MRLRASQACLPGAGNPLSETASSRICRLTSWVCPCSSGMRETTVHDLVVHGYRARGEAC
jgi:hypothetical protein